VLTARGVLAVWSYWAADAARSDARRDRSADSTARRWGRTGRRRRRLVDEGYRSLVAAVRARRSTPVLHARRLDARASRRLSVDLVGGAARPRSAPARTRCRAWSNRCAKRGGGTKARVAWSGRSPSTPVASDVRTECRWRLTCRHSGHTGSASSTLRPISSEIERAAVNAVGKLHDRSHFARHCRERRRRAMTEASGQATENRAIERDCRAV
jgi:hypothetical protein